VAVLTSADLAVFLATVFFVAMGMLLIVHRRDLFRNVGLQESPARAADGFADWTAL
jgi:hypothetical protein